MTSDFDLIIIWGIITITVIGLFLAAVRVKDWIERNRKPDPLEPSQEYTAERFSLRKWK